jgi:predicted dehydrogenase/threonine dehydrogenase-like Zn-dependent dehydrogenase
MKAVVFKPGRGEVSVEDIPAPQPQPGHVLIRNEYSLISAGTERSRVQSGKEPLIAKARARPDQARKVLKAVRDLGPIETYRMVSNRLDAPALLGYSSAGLAMKVGDGVDDLRAGARVAAAGQGYASHAEIVSVPRNLCVVVPDGLTSRWAAFSTIGAIALQGIHQAGVEPGSRIVVIGLGLVGQVTVRILRSYGYDVVGIDLDERMAEMARATGVAAISRGDEDLDGSVRRRWRGAGADAVIVTAATKSSDPVTLAGRLARDRANIVIVGDVNVAPPRASFYGKELSIRYSRSYGPGRYDPLYEEGGVDYPEGHIPWPERRNLEEFLRLVAMGLDLESLEPVVFPVEEARAAYAALEETGEGRRVAVLLHYGHRAEAEVTDLVAPAAKAARRETTTSPRRRGAVRIAAVGAGSFATGVLFPQLRRQADVHLSWITTGGGLTASHEARRWRFDGAVAGVEEGMARGDTDCVMVLTRHDTHGSYAVKVLSRGIGLFCEKPLALSEEELESVARAWLETQAPAMVGFNRRFAPAVRQLKQALTGRRPVQVVYRVFAGRLPADHWYFDLRHGGRILGEVCHFIDTASFLIGSVPVSVLASSGDGQDPARAQSVSVHIVYGDGSTAAVVYGGRTPSGVPKEALEVAADGLAARIDDFRSLTIWNGDGRTTPFKGGPKGHAEEMQGLVRLLKGEPVPEADFVQSLWTTLATCRAAASLRQGGPMYVQPETPGLRQALELPVAVHTADGSPGRANSDGARTER